MYFNKTIQRLTAGLMLLLFAFSVTPKQLIHDAITGHKHRSVNYEAASNFQSPKSNFQCNWHHDVVESPFIEQPGFRLPQPDLIYSTYNISYTDGYYSSKPFFSSLRGPPCQA